MLTTTNYSHAIILNLSHHRFTGFYQQNVKCSNVHFYNKTRMHHSGECTEYSRWAQCATQCGERAAVGPVVGTQLRRGDWRPRTHPTVPAEQRTVGRGKLPCSTAQYSTVQHSAVQYSTGMRTRYNAGPLGNDWWPALTPAWFKLKTADCGSDNQCYLQLIPWLLATNTSMTQPSPHIFILHLFASCEYFWGRTNIESLNAQLTICIYYLFSSKFNLVQKKLFLSELKLNFHSSSISFIFSVTNNSLLYI